VLDRGTGHVDVIERAEAEWMDRSIPHLRKYQQIAPGVGELR
jgi:hypothetical protein